jgi:ELWxxDGT repeat protein
VQFKSVLGDILDFTGPDGDHGVELWRTDGTLEGTRMVRDINPGPGSSGIQSLVAFHSELYFGANDGVHGYELWKTDGTENGTVLVTDLNPGPNGSALFSLRATGDSLYFSESSFACGQPAALYTTDGTASGTHLLRQFVTQGTSSIGFEGGCIGWPPGDFLSFGGLTYFIASDGVSGLQLWRTDGTALGTAMVKDICSGKCSSFLISDGVLEFGVPALQVINGRLFFFANDGVHGFEPWTSDGTEAGTRLVKDVFPGPESSTFGGGVTALGSAFVFPANSSGPGWELWTSDGTETGTFLASSAGGSLPPYLIIPVGPEVFFAASAGTIRVPNNGSRRLWKMDSAAGPASVVADSILDPTALVNFGGTLFFAASVLDGLALWKTDGTPGGTSVVRPLARREKASYSPHRVQDLPWRR